MQMKRHNVKPSHKPKLSDTMTSHQLSQKLKLIGNGSTVYMKLSNILLKGGSTVVYSEWYDLDSIRRSVMVSAKRFGSFGDSGPPSLFSSREMACQILYIWRFMGKSQTLLPFGGLQ